MFRVSGDPVEPRLMNAGAQWGAIQNPEPGDIETIELLAEFDKEKSKRDD